MTTPSEAQEITVINSDGTFTMQGMSWGVAQSTTGELDVDVFGADTNRVGSFSSVSAVFFTGQVEEQE